MFNKCPSENPSYTGIHSTQRILKHKKKRIPFAKNQYIIDFELIVI
ncbi:hypothetical protein GPAL_2171 [Glaciecola pallidula DSM 14239 = ACAM 615]|uniref:Uncharacterized protein n=1 Tax=Brumicola pallidula DSM 14239 = ACAM 615 TaxID=1121922 RepID=K6ZFA5_9ALTE|nr:hypothetical protein GPAL_2171 [Glaciecola pallidula DSM 14239 = ACAM 615]